MGLVAWPNLYNSCLLLLHRQPQRPAPPYWWEPRGPDLVAALADGGHLPPGQA